MKTTKGLSTNTTYPPKCYWCGEYGEVKYLKISLKKEKPACLRCYGMMVVKPEFHVEPTKCVICGITHL
jgi:hypothetical protein